MVTTAGGDSGVCGRPQLCICPCAEANYPLPHKKRLRSMRSHEHSVHAGNAVPQGVPLLCVETPRDTTNWLLPQRATQCSTHSKLSSWCVAASCVATLSLLTALSCSRAASASFGASPVGNSSIRSNRGGGSSSPASLAGAGVQVNAAPPALSQRAGCRLAICQRAWGGAG